MPRASPTSPSPRVNAAMCASRCFPRGSDRAIPGTFPNIGESRLLAQYVHCARTASQCSVTTSCRRRPAGHNARVDIRGARAGNAGRSACPTGMSPTGGRHRSPLPSAGGERRGCVFSFDRDGRIVWISPSVQQALGARLTTGSGGSAEVFPPTNRTPTTRLSRVLAGGVVRNASGSSGPTGSPIGPRCSPSPPTATDGRISGGRQAALRLIDTG